MIKRMRNEDGKEKQRISKRRQKRGKRMGNENRVGGLGQKKSNFRRRNRKGGRRSERMSARVDVAHV